MQTQSYQQFFPVAMAYERLEPRCTLLILVGHSSFAEEIEYER